MDPTNLYQLPDLYDEQYLDYRDDLSFYSRLADDQGGPILELGAGTGRVTATLAKRGYEVVGLDNSEAMLERARAYVASQANGKQVSLLLDDIRTFELNRTFSLIVAPFNVFAHLYTMADQDAALNSIRRHLASDGAFALDLFIPKSESNKGIKREPMLNRSLGVGRELFLVQHHNPENQLLESRYYLDTTNIDGSLYRKTAILKQRYYTRFELTRALKQAGMTRTLFYGSFNREPLTHESKQMVVIAR